MDKKKFSPWFLGLILFLVLAIISGAAARTYLMLYWSSAEKNSVVNKWPVWKTVEIGTYKSVEVLRAMVVAGGAKIFGPADDFIGGQAQDLIGSPDFKLTQAEELIDLVVVSNADLGRPDGCTLAETCRLAAERGLERCPVDTGPYLRVQYGYEPDKYLIVVSATIFAREDGRPSFFGVNNTIGGERWLCNRYAGPENYWNGDRTFVFRLPPK